MTWNAGWSRVWPGVLAALVGGFAYGAQPASPTTDGAAILGLRQAHGLTLDGLPEGAGSFSIDIAIDGRPLTIAFAPHSVRSADYHVLERAGDVVRVIDPPAERNVRGRVAGFPDSRAAGAVLPAGLRALIIHGGERFWIEPLSDLVTDTTRRDHVLYRAADVIAPPATCTLLEPQFVAASPRRRAAGQDPCPGVGFHAAEVALEADFLYFLHYGSIAGTVAQMETVIHTMNLQYETELDITHLITTTVVNTVADPYSTSDPAGLLCQFRNYWNANNDSVQRDVAQLFTGRVLTGPPIGIAWRGVVCNAIAIDPACPGGDNLAYSVVESNFNGVNGSMACKTDLSAHELGHTWNADHCSCSLYTMNATLASCNNQFHPEFSIPEMLAFRNTRSCLQFVSDDIELLRILITPEADTVPEGGILNLEVLADLPDPPCIADVDIAGEVSWTVNPPGAGSLDSFARFFAGQVSGDTLVGLTASYDGAYGQDVETVFITIEDTAVDEREIVMALEPTVDPATLTPGQTFDVDVLLSAPSGDITDVRLLQFDVVLTFGATLDAWTWMFDGLMADTSYNPLVTHTTVHSAVYTEDAPADGLIVALGPTAQRVARLTLTAQTSGSINVRGLPLPPNTSHSARFVSGFDAPIDFSQAEGNLQGGTLAITVTDPPVSVIGSIPPNDAIDARQPSEPDGVVPQGWTAVVLLVDGAAADVSIGDLAITQQGGAVPAPAITAIGVLGSDQLGVEFDGPLVPGAWTTITHVPSGTAVRLGFLPADVNGDATSSPLDILALIDALNGVGMPLPAWSSDVNRSGITEPLDILRTIDLLNGAGDFAVWNGATLP